MTLVHFLIILDVNGKSITFSIPNLTFLRICASLYDYFKRGISYPYQTKLLTSFWLILETEANINTGIYALKKCRTTGKSFLIGKQKLQEQSREFYTWGRLDVSKILQGFLIHSSWRALSWRREQKHGFHYPMTKQTSLSCCSLYYELINSFIHHLRFSFTYMMISCHEW